MWGLAIIENFCTEIFFVGADIIRPQSLKPQFIETCNQQTDNATHKTDNPQNPWIRKTHGRIISAPTREVGGVEKIFLGWYN